MTSSESDKLLAWIESRGPHEFAGSICVLCHGITTQAIHSIDRTARTDPARAAFSSVGEVSCVRRRRRGLQFPQAVLREGK